MQNVVSLGHAPAVRASRALTRINARKACIRTLSLVRRKAVTLAVMSAVAVYAGVLFGSDPLIYSAALAALGFVYIATECQKGGEA